MKRSLFTKSLLCGSVGLFGCRPEAGAQREEGPREGLKFYGMPSGGDLIASILPTKVFRRLATPEPMHHMRRFSKRGPDESSRDWVVRFRAEREQYVRRLREAQDYFESWELWPEDYATMERLYDLLFQQKREDLKLVYDTTGSPGMISSLDLTGARLDLSPISLVDPDDRFCVGPKPSVSSQCFDELLKFRRIKRLFLNYTECPFPRFLQLFHKRDRLEALGIPMGLSPTQLEEVVSVCRIDVLDLSGYEIGTVRDRLIEVAIRAGVRWLVFSGVDFSSGWMNVDWTQASDVFRGMIKRRSIGVFDYEE